MELEELIENTLRRKHLEEMMNRPEKGKHSVNHVANFVN